ncbi:MAG: hypothetical protein J6Y36_01965 [Treponema sp.]|uniref:hypothetical protein n=1 Tax=Treponema sp. TaxID=166 RepID=UPI001B6B0630|nr:hypothetical protein [Treponema sp.]MBP5401903.1 hypothetical protein [Treponema sp.]MBR5932456.1 hypothetical protein [Treponema sp.]
MKYQFKILTLFLCIFAVSQSAFARDKLDDFLDSYETFIEKAESAVKNKETSKIDSLKKEQQKLMDQKEKLNKSLGDFTIKQAFRYGQLNARWGVAIGALETTKGLKKANEKVDEMLEEDSSKESKKKDDKSKKA